MLKIDQLYVSYGYIEAIKGISLHVNPGEIVTLIGANGAGKSTLLKSISNLMPIKSGTIMFEDEDISNVNPTKVVALGVTHVPEGRRVFKDMNVEENLLLGAFLRKDNEIYSDLEDVYERFPILYQRRQQHSANLSGGEQQMLAIGRALMARPKMLLLDEPSMGLAPMLVREIFEIIKQINHEGTTVLLVEQNAKMALSIAHRGYVIETGKVMLSGTSTELSKSEEVVKLYLGG
ncbi:MAG: ABC transporter ATP-binding protein [Erysipelothrix sp.]|jgi:branched-chain amino acid transport system ATP-binding protein|nr:ABC transporter ATP-binding protein [Erysipelothrix sp.]